MSYGPTGSVAKAVVAVKSGLSKKKKSGKNAFELCKVNLLDCKKNKPFKTRWNKTTGSTNTDVKA